MKDEKRKKIFNIREVRTTLFILKKKKKIIFFFSISTHLEDQPFGLAHHMNCDWNAAAPLEIWLVEEDEC